jgi:hypothetical protein
VDELKAYVGNPLNQRVWSWWWKSQNRAAVTAEVATTMGRQRLGDPGGPQFAAACWEGLLKARPQLAEEVGEFSMRPGSGGGGLEGVLRLYEELTSLYFRNGELDPYGSKLNAWVNELFQGKGHFILERNWKAAQPYHTVLAHIFVQRGILDKGFGSAAYQLRAVLEDADRRWQDPQERFFQPLPEIRMLLAETYQKLGGARQDDAMAMYIQAAEAYLDTDALDSSQLMLNAAAKARAAAQRSAVGQINQIVNARRGASNLAAAKVALDAPWLNSTSVLVTADFLARQRFKLLADAAAGAEAGERLDAALRSYNLVTGSRPVLVGTADLVRWQQVESRLLAGINAQSARPVIRAASGGISAANLRLTLQSENHPFEIAVAGDTKLAAQVVSTLGVIDTLKARLYLTPRLGKIVVTAPSDQMNALRGIVGKMREAQIPLSVMSERGPA